MKKFLLKTAVGILISGFALTAFAVECNKKSPSFVAEGDAYYDVAKTPPLTREQKEIVKQFYQASKGRWKGKGTEVYCKGSEKNPRKVTIQQTLKAEMKRQGNSRLLLDLDIRVPSEGKTSHENMYFFGKKDYSEILDLSSHKVVLRLKTYVSRGGNHGASLWETITELNIDKGVLQVNTLRYINGYFSIQVIREFTR